MCGRKYNLEYLSWALYRQLFGFEGQAPSNFPPRYNIKPTQFVPVVISQDGERSLRDMSWWMLPPNAKTFKSKYTTFNARMEKMESSYMYRYAVKERRCIVPVSGYYEWRDEGGTKKQPYAFFNKDNSPLLLAGLWNENEHIDPNEKVAKNLASDYSVATYTVITREPNPVAAEYHNRMPAILTEDQISTWLEADWPEAKKCIAEPYGPDNMDIMEMPKDQSEWTAFHNK